jgi:outer membrane lipoprotein LolB
VIVGASVAARSMQAAAVLAAALLAGCATAPAPFETAGEEVVSGRLALRIEASASEPRRAFSAAFELKGNADAGGLDLSTPLGSVIARARWKASEVALVTPQGTRSYPDLDSLTRDVLGEVVPLAALFDWLRGRPWPGAPSVDASAAGFEQLGWRVDLTRFEQAAVAADHLAAPAMSVRVQLDRR